MTTLFVATTGGHLAQLDKLAQRVPPDGTALWVTPDSTQGRSLLTDRDAEFTHVVPGRSVSGVLRCLPIAHRIWRNREVTRAISTGSGIALGFLPYLAARGVECHYVESAARVTSPSLTGRIMRWVPGVRCYTQHPGWASRHWHYGGSQFDCYAPVPAHRDRRGPIRVLVTVGTSNFPFRRMLDPLVRLLGPQGELSTTTGSTVEVLWQTGSTPVDGLPIDGVRYLSGPDLERALSVADIVISHAGTGSAMAAFEAGLKPVLVTRLHEYGEASDDHQGQLAEELRRRGLASYRRDGAVGVAELTASMSWSVRRVDEPSPFSLLPRNERSGRR
ncbi:glycosyltransferase [Saccharopolyspora sp. TS4A08]|uniref:Glycosyltransferase n=1 Tax=Saccharopolyspora ipomoeae TaxID=3042027 RepID=A0ABT6PNM6_9PSEU|nr:glycosyltransferase [Saccharopolyspora sp. TS4A08]MDI2029613.1 glycosyltransferase [Saccharopolyspora sp. TS4A08]